MANVALSTLYFLRSIRNLPKVPGLTMKLMRHFPVFSKHIVTTEVFDGVQMKLNLDDLLQQHIFTYGYYEKDATEMWKHCIKGAKNVVDIGANVGYYSIITAKYGPKDVQIYSFEPMTRTNQRAWENIKLNAFNNIHLQKLAVSDTTKKETIAMGESANWGGSKIVHDAVSDKVHSEQIETVTLDAFVAEHNIQQIDVVKMDIEGYEPFALKGMQASLAKFKPIVFIEIEEVLLSKFNYKAEDVFQYFWNLGYSAYTIQPGKKLKPQNTTISMDGLLLFAPIGDGRISGCIVNS